MDIETDNALEIKAGVPAAPPADAAVTHADLMRAFEEFKQTNDQKLSETRSVDVVLEEKLARLDSVMSTQAQRLEAIELKQARPAIGNEKSAARHENQPGIEHKVAFEAYVRSGESGNLRALEIKA